MKLRTAARVMAAAAVPIAILLAVPAYAYSPSVLAAFSAERRVARTRSTVAELIR